MILAIVAYCVVMSLVACRIATMAAWRMLENSRDSYPSLYTKKSRPDGDQWTGAAFLGLLGALVWPVTVLAYLCRGRLFAPPKHIRDAQREQYIAELEARLDLDGVRY